MKIVITNHARERIVERVGCRRDKVEKVAKKAYKSNEKICEKFLKKREFNGYENVDYRLFHGCVFVFDTESGNAICITCLIYER